MDLLKEKGKDLIKIMEVYHASFDRSKLAFHLILNSLSERQRRGARHDTGRLQEKESPANRTISREEKSGRIKQIQEKKAVDQVRKVESAGTPRLDQGPVFLSCRQQVEGQRRSKRAQEHRENKESSEDDHRHGREGALR